MCVFGKVFCVVAHNILQIQLPSIAHELDLPGPRECCVSATFTNVSGIVMLSLGIHNSDTMPQKISQQ